jgi:hypothetical protein
MKHLFLTVLFLISFVPSVVASEQPNKPVDIFVHFNSDARDVYYVGQQRMDYLKRFNLDPAENSPCFINCGYKTDDSRASIFDLLPFARDVRVCSVKDRYTISFLKVIPLQYFLTGKDQFKKQGDILFSCTKKIDEQDIVFQVKLGENPRNIDTKVLMEIFFGPIASYVEEDMYELLEKKIIELKTQGRFCEHGPKAYKKNDSIKNQKKHDDESMQQSKVQQQRGQKLQQNAVLYSRIKKILGISVAAIMAYLLYQKIYEKHLN